MLARVQDPSVRREWLHHWNNINIPDSSDAQIRWMKEAGMEAETVCRWMEVALIAASRAVA